MTQDRALSTVVGPSWRAQDFVGSKSLSDLKRRRPEVSTRSGTKVFGCFAGLSMGDKWAPAIVWGAHFQDDRGLVSMDCITASLSSAMAAEGFIVGPPIEVKEGWDMSSSHLFALLIRLSLAGRVAVMWMGVLPGQKTTAEKRPRTLGGFDVLEPKVLSGNLHMHQCLALIFFSVSEATKGFCRPLQEHTHGSCPGGYYWPKSLWSSVLTSVGLALRIRRLLHCYALPDAMLPLNDDACARALMSVWKGRAPPWPRFILKSFAGSLHGSRVMLQKWNSQREHASMSAVPLEPVAEGLADPRRAGRFVSRLWSTQLAEALPWKTIRAYRFKRTNHINVLESHAHKILMQIAPMDSRLVVFQDSLVTLGANAEGGSSSEPLNRILRQSMSLQLGKTLYPCSIHARPASRRPISGQVGEAAALQPSVLVSGREVRTHLRGPR